MQIGIIGSGPVGSVVGPRWASKGHAIVCGSHNPAGDKMTALLNKIGSNAQAVEIKGVAKGCDAVLLATPLVITFGSGTFPTLLAKNALRLLRILV